MLKVEYVKMSIRNSLINSEFKILSINRLVEYAVIWDRIKNFLNNVINKKNCFLNEIVLD